jgi:hypothetical protein
MQVLCSLGCSDVSSLKQSVGMMAMVLNTRTDCGKSRLVTNFTTIPADISTGIVFAYTSM